MSNKWTNNSYFHMSEVITKELGLENRNDEGRDGAGDEAGEGAAHLAGWLGGVEPAGLPPNGLHVIPAINLSHLAVVPKTDDSFRWSFLCNSHL